MRFILFLTFSMLHYACQSQTTSYDHKAIEYNNRALKLIQGPGDISARLEKSNALLDSAIHIDPRYVIAYQNKLNNLITLKKYDLAIDVADVILVLKPSIEVSTAKAGLLYKNGKETEASIVLNEAIVLANEQYDKHPSLNLLTNIIVAYSLNGQKQKGLDLLYSEMGKFDKDPKLKQEISTFERNLPLITFDEILNSHTVK